MISNYIPVLIFFIIIALFVIGAFAFAIIFRPKDKKFSPEKHETYECGEDPEGIAWIRFNVGYYLVALIFILFDVETVFLFPWALTLKKLGLIVFIEMIIFIGILFLGWIYAYKKGDLEWK